MEKIIDNKKTRIIDVLKNGIKKDSKLSIISAYFTIYGFDKLKEELESIENLRFLFIEPTFIKEKEEKREFYINRKNREKQISGTEYEIKLRNELRQSEIAKECAEWIREKVEFKSLKKSDTSSARTINVQNPDESNFVINGQMDFTASGLGVTQSKKYEIHSYSNEKDATTEALNWFDEIWNNEELAEEVKDEVLKNIETIYNENTPEFIYFVTLYNIFREYLDDLTEENIIKPKTGFAETKVWNKLYQFQKDGVMGAISKLEEHNGCIIADSVGLGKTFEALAVIKYYELRNHRVLVLSPKKLRDNWNMYRMNDVRNILSEDRFGYDILNHTDLSREKGMSGDINIETVNWGNYDLIVIDESHNFRNNDPRKGKKTRYQKLMDDIIKSGVKTKVLMLSATPVNNKMTDLKNQVAFITEGNDRALSEVGIPSIQETLRVAQLIFNKWQDKPIAERNLEDLLKSFNINYFKLLDTLTIARSRKHIEKYYDLAEIGKFPERLKPENKKSGIDLQKEFSDFNEINNTISKLKLSIYSPLQYVLPEKVKYYEEKYDMVVNEGQSSFKQSDREKNIVNLMRVNILKRLESSVYSYNLTLNKIDSKITSVLNKIENINDSDYFETEAEDQEESIDGDDEQLESMMIGDKIRVSLNDMDLVRWREDLEDDHLRFQELINQSKSVTPIRDEKLDTLKKIITDKINNPINKDNNKILIFSAYADTANYLYDNLSDWIKNEFNINTALVTGGGSNKVTSKVISNHFDSVLTNFSPISKERDKIYPDIKEEIDILIATDCISEGQNLQDCDCLINYDIHWNPVRIIQRFGRIDRIGSKNDKVKLINFWPDMELESYIKLEQRVRGRMMLLNTSATGEEDLINESEQEVMNDIEYRKNQLMKLQEDIVDLEDISGNISITDLTMNDFRMDLASYMKDHKDELENAPLGMYAVADKNLLGENIESGIIFALKQANFSELESKEINAIHPYYMVYIQNDGHVKYGYTQAKYVLDIFKKLSNGVNEVNEDLTKIFNSETDDARNMSEQSKLLEKTVQNIIGKKQESGASELFSLGKTTIAQQSLLNGLDDFELVSFLIIK